MIAGDLPYRAIICAIFASLLLSAPGSSAEFVCAKNQSLQVTPMCFGRSRPGAQNNHAENQK
jgi:hypothetical protein